ncbi:MAG: PDZ domain-containing protein [Steroidobacteraceae bacterium]
MFRKVICALAVLCIVGVAQAAEADKQKQDEDINARLEAAQERLDEAAREVAELSMAISEDAMPFVMQFHGPGSRAVLGINIGAGSEQADGVKVINVSPGGPAARAGLKAGDVLLRVDDESLKRDDAGSPRAKLLRHLREVEPGETVKLQYRRGDKTATADVKAEVLQHPNFTIPLPPGAPFPPGAPLPPRALGFGHFAGAFGAAELAPLTPQLGRYFGTEEGLLVVRAPRDERLKLEDGDVILDIDGRKPSSPAHALRILGSYQSGETVKLNVQRMRKRLTLEVAVPDSPRRADARLMTEEDVLMPAEGAIRVERGVRTDRDL